MWSIFIESFDYFRRGLSLFVEVFLGNLVRIQKQLHTPLPRLFFMLMPMTEIHPGYRTRLRIMKWNEEIIRVIANASSFFNTPFSILDHFHSTSLRPEASDGNHFGDWMKQTDGNDTASELPLRLPVLSKNTVNSLLNFICND